MCCFLPQKFYFLFSNLPSNLPFKKKSNLLHSPHGRKKNDLLFLLTVVVLVYFVSFKEEERRTTKNYEEEEEDTQKRERKERTFAFTVLRAVVSERSLSSRDSFNATIL